MKRCLNLITILLILGLFTVSNNTVYCHEKLEPNNPLLNDYIYNKIDKISSTINLDAKLLLLTPSTEVIQNKKKYIDDIDFEISNLNSLIKETESLVPQYKNDSYNINVLYASNLMLTEYRYSLALLKLFVEYLGVNDDIAYKNITDFFIIKSEADRKLNAAKLNQPR